MKVEKYPGNKYKEKLEEMKSYIERFSLGPISEDIIVYNRRELFEKLEIINSLYHKALESMEEPKSDWPEKPPKTFKEGGAGEMPSFAKELVDMDALERQRVFYIALKNQDYTCLLCDIGVNPKYKEETFKRRVATDVLELQPHRIIHRRFMKNCPQDSKCAYELENIAILCPNCHEKESTIFNRSWNEFFENGRVMEWKKLIHKSFNFLKDFISQQ